MEPLATQLRYTLRKLRRAPLFSAVAVLTLAVGIGSTAAIFSVVHGVLLRPLPYAEPDALVGVWHTAPGLGFDEVNQSPALHFYYAEHARSFESVGMWDNGTVTVTGLAEPEVVPSMSVTHRTLPLLGVTPALGRTFSEAEDTPDGPQAVVLSHGFWQRRFGGAADVLGRALSVNGVSREIVGVLPEGFTFMANDTDLYLPFRFDRGDVTVGNFSYQGIARLAEGATLDQANEEVARMVPLATEAYPGGLTLEILEQARFGPSVRPLKQDVVGDVGSVLWVLLGTVGIILLIACANVANLFLVRTEGRHREMAVRAALGAGRGGIAGQLVLESVVLGIFGGALGLALAWAGLEIIVAMGPEALPRLHEIGIDPTVLGFTFMTSVLAGLAFGAFPALRIQAADLVTSLKEGGRGGGAGRERHRARNTLVVAQVALALVLLTGSGLMIRSFQALQAVEPGFSAPEEVLTFRVAIPEAEIAAPEQVALAHQRILRSLEGLPGVASATMSSSVVMDGWDSSDALEVEANPGAPGQIPPIRRYKFLAPGYFQTLGNHIVAGRDFTWTDIENRNRVVILSEALARAEFGSASASLGERVRQGLDADGDWYEVVGVAADERDDGMAADPVPTVYWPQVTEDFWGAAGTFTLRSMAYALRVRSGDPTALLEPTRHAVWAVNPNLPLARVATLDELAARSMARTSFTLVMLGIASGVALFLGIVGIYGVISYIVAQRTREIGVRMALGAERAAVTRMVLRQALLLAVAGVGIGVVAAAFSTRLMSSLLFGVSPLDPVTFASVAALLAAVALMAGYLPARRASAVDPVEALRSEG